MEPITHLMTGACLARAGFNRKAAYATLAMVVGAEAPDLDTLWSVEGPVASFQHHRGITHTFLGLPFEALAIVGCVWLLHRWRVRRAAGRVAAVEPAHAVTDETIRRDVTAAPVRWGLLYGFVLIALLSHILLDWTNNYGVRPFFPFDPHWYAGSIVFIFEPVLFAVLLIALVAPVLFGLIGSEVGARRSVFRGRGWAIFALLATVGVWGWRQAEHDAALRLAAETDYGAGVEVLRTTASPYPGNPFRWHTVVETPEFYQLATVDALHETVETTPAQDIVYKPPTTLGTLLAKRTWLGEVYLDWSSWGVVTDVGPVASFTGTWVTAVATPAGTTAVTFRDLRFQYDTFLMDGRKTPPLSGTVYIDADRRVICMEMNGSVQSQAGQPCSRL